LFGSPYPLYWHSYKSYHEFSTISGTGIEVVYTGIFETLILQVRDRFENPYNDAFHASSLGENSVHQVTLVGDGEDLPINLIEFDDYIGKYTFNFRINELYSNL